MAVVLQKKKQLGPGVTIREFEIKRDDRRDAEVYKKARELEDAMKPSSRAASVRSERPQKD